MALERTFMYQKDTKLLSDKPLSTKLIINREKDDQGNPFYVCVLGEADHGTISIIKVGTIRLSPDVFEMILSDMTPHATA